MHVAEIKKGMFFRPACIGLAPSLQGNDSSGVQYLPSSVRDAIWNFLRKRAEFLMASPGLDMKTYQDFPDISQIDEGDNPKQMCINTFADQYSWPPRWHVMERSPNQGVQSEAYALMSKWRNELRTRRAEVTTGVLEEIDAIISRYYFASTMYVAIREHRSNDILGIEMARKELACDVPFDLACFAATAHNTLIELLRWMDTDLLERNAAMQARETRFAAERELLRKQDDLLARERRHSAAVKKAKAMLAKEKKAAQALMDAANLRMKEAMTVVELLRSSNKHITHQDEQQIERHAG